MLYERLKSELFQISGKAIQKEIKFGGLSEKIDSLTILENYYGLVKTIEVNIKHDSIKEKHHNLLFYPMLITEKNNLCYINNIIEKKEDKDLNYKNNNNNIIDLTTEKELYNFKINNIKLIKPNYINYNEINFNIIEYFGGITQLLPFISLIRNLLENKKIKLINSQDKSEFLISFLTDILCIFLNIIGYYKEYQVHIEKFSLFFFCILSEIDITLSSQIDKILEIISRLPENIQSKNFKILQNLIAILTKNAKDKNLSQFYSKLEEENLNKENNFYFFFIQLYT